jgi:hypothetical protein
LIVVGRRTEPSNAGAVERAMADAILRHCRAPLVDQVGKDTLPQLLARFEALRRTSSAWDGWEREARAAFEARVAASVLGEAEDARLEQVMTTDVL